MDKTTIFQDVLFDLIDDTCFHLQDKNKHENTRENT